MRQLPADPTRRPDGEGPLLSLENIAMDFGRGASTKRAVDDVSLNVVRGETLGIVGESGSGKTTLVRCAARLLRPTAGRIRFDGTDITEFGAKVLAPFRRRMQLVFQDPYGSLNPRHRVERIIEEPLIVHTKLDANERHSRVGEIMEMVGLDPALAGRRPADFSGGQRQRINIARALILKPELVLCDEPVSALDLSIQAQILNLLKEVQTELNLTYVFVTHDIAVVRYVSDRVAVMNQGRLVEVADTSTIFRSPAHDYTKLLLAGAR